MSKSKIEPLAPGTMFFRLDDNLRVMPVHQVHLIDQISDVMGLRWGYQSMIGKDILVSSTFLGIDSGSIFSSNSSPRVFETMIFRKGISAECYRFSSLDECVEAHHKILDFLKEEAA